MDFSETVIYDLKLATDDQSDKTFLLTSKLCPLGAVCPLPRGYIYTCIKSWKKKCIKADFKEISLKLATNDRSDKMFLLTSKFRPQRGCLPLPRGYIMYKSWKKLYKIRFQSHFFETCNNWMKWQDISVDIKTLSPGGCLPLPWGYIHV